MSRTRRGRGVSRIPAVLGTFGTLACLILAAGVVHLVAGASAAAAQNRIGATSWTFQGSSMVAQSLNADAESSFRGSVRRWVLQQRARGHPLLQVGPPHPLFASHYDVRALDVVVLVAAVTGDGPVVGVAGFYGNDDGHHGTDSVAPFSAGDQEVSGSLRSYLDHDLDWVTVVVGGPRAGGLLVNSGGVRQNVDGLPGRQVAFDDRGITWLYASIPATTEHRGDGVITVTDGNGNLTDVLYYGRPGAGGVLG